MDVIRDTTNSKTFAFVVADNRCEVCVEIALQDLIENGSTVLRAEDNMDKKKAQRSCHGENYRSDLRPSGPKRNRTWGVAPRWYISAPPALLLATFVACVATLSGCKSAPPFVATKILCKQPLDPFPPRPTTPPPPFKVFHQTDNSITLVTDEHATDNQIEAIIWQLRDTAHAHTFATLHINQKAVDKRDPIMWFHLYRGSKCASEKYTSGALPCGGAYHASGDYILGSFANKDHDDGALLKDEDHETHLWNPDAPYTAPSNP